MIVSKAPADMVYNESQAAYIGLGIRVTFSFSVYTNTIILSASSF